MSFTSRVILKHLKIGIANCLVIVLWKTFDKLMPSFFVSKKSILTMGHSFILSLVVPDSRQAKGEYFFTKYTSTCIFLPKSSKGLEINVCM